MTSKANEEIELAGTLLRQTDMAYLIDFGLDAPVWVPKSKVYSDDDIEEEVLSTWSMPEWLAAEKGLI